MRSALAIVALALVAAGCGGDPVALTESPTPTPAPAPDATTVGGAPQEEPAGLNEISKANAKAGDLVKISAVTPKDFTKAHCDKVIVVVFYQPDGTVDRALYAEVEAATKGRKDILKRYYTPADTKEMGDLQSKLGLFASPGLAIVNRAGKIQTFWTTYVDQALISLQLDRAAGERPCKVTSEDAPAVGTNSALEDAALVASGRPLPTAPEVLPVADPGVIADGAGAASDTIAASPATPAAAGAPATTPIG